MAYNLPLTGLLATIILWNRGMNMREASSRLVGQTPQWYLETKDDDYYNQHLLLLLLRFMFMRNSLKLCSSSKCYSPGRVSSSFKILCHVSLSLVTIN